MADKNKMNVSAVLGIVGALVGVVSSFLNMADSVNTLGEKVKENKTDKASKQ